MTNVNYFDPKLLLINEITTFNSGLTMFEISYCEESKTPSIVFNDDIECVFRKSGINKYLVLCETQENKKTLVNYKKIIDEIKEQILFITEDNLFIMGKDFMRIKFKPSDKLPYNKKINVAVCNINKQCIWTRLTLSKDSITRFVFF